MSTAENQYGLCLERCKLRIRYMTRGSSCRISADSSRAWQVRNARHTHQQTVHSHSTLLCEVAATHLLAWTEVATSSTPDHQTPLKLNSYRRRKQSCLTVVRIGIRRPRPTQGGARQGIMRDPPELNGLKPWRRGGFRCFWEAGKLLAGCWWKLFGRLVSGGKC